MSDDAKPRRYHDLGGLPGGPIEISDSVLAPWEKRVDIVRGLLGDKNRRIMRADVLRNTIETMGEDMYKSLTYYELWMEAVRRVVVEAGILSDAEIETRMAEVCERLGLGEGQGEKS
jgi:hypothetical protein